VTLGLRQFLLLQRTIGRLRVLCVSPNKALIAGEEPKPLTGQEVTKILTELPPSLGGVPTTVVLASTGGFTLEAHELADRRPDRTLILIEPNTAGGWSVHAPTQNKSLADLLDPEGDVEKIARIREAIEAQNSDLLGSGISADKLAAKLQLSLQLVEAELKSYARENPGLAAKRLDGRVVLFQEGTFRQPSSGAARMPMWESIKSLISRQESPRKKVSRLSEQRTALRQQRDTVYENIQALERKESEATAGFENAGTSAQQRIATEVVQLRAEMERRQQLLQTIDKKIGIVSASIHQLEMAEQVSEGSLRELEDLATSADQLEEGLATLEQLEESTDAITAITSPGPSEKVQDVLAELRARAAPKETAPPTAEPAKVAASTVPQKTPTAPVRESTPTSAPSSPADRPKRAEPEAG